MVTNRALPLERLRVFIASPGDVFRERDHVSALADELNRGAASDSEFFLEVVRWETHARPDMGRPQQIIFDQIGAIDIFIGIMWQRFGTPSGVADSGTEEEFDHAFRSWQQTGHPRMLCYFSRAPIEPPGTVEQAEQLLKVTQFRARVNKVGLAWTYRTDAEFKEQLREHLQQVLKREFAGRHPPLDRNLEALLEVEKERCRARNVAFLTPNLLLLLLAARGSAARRIFDMACPGEAENTVTSLRDYVPVDAEGQSLPYSDFDWYDRDDIQAARRQAKMEGARTIDARHLLLGLLTTKSETRTALRQKVGLESFDRLQELAESGPPPATTPGIRNFFNSSKNPPAKD